MAVAALGFVIHLGFATANPQAKGEGGEEFILRPSIPMDLSGPWTVKLDPEDSGMEQGWYAAPMEGLPINLPGTTDEAGYGTPVDHETMTYQGLDPESLVAGFGQQPDQGLHEMGRLVREHYYVGPAWYERVVQIPSSWIDKQVHLRLERILWESRVWIDGIAIGSCDSLVAEHRYALGSLTPGMHRITVRVDNRPILPTGMIQHGYGEETQTRWNGMVGALELEMTDPVWIENLKIFPAPDCRSLSLRMKIGNAIRDSMPARVHVVVRDESKGTVLGDHFASLDISSEYKSEKEITIPLTARPKPWDEFNPALYELCATIQVDQPDHALSHTRVNRFGFRQVVRDGADLRINDRRIFLRGILDCAVYPLTGYAPMDPESWMEILRTIKSYGFNHVRYHTWCPPEAAFEAADRLGIYLAPETSFWPPGGPVRAPQLGENPEVLAWVRREIHRISEAYGNHPSFCFFCIGNEFAPGTKWDVVNEVIAEAKSYDPRRLYNGSTARTRVPEDDFWVTHVTGNGSTRGMGPPHTNWDFSKSAVDLPVVSHETGQRPAFPDYSMLLPKFTGVLKPYNLEYYEQLAIESGIAPWIEAYAPASALFALDQYKSEHEAFLRTPGWDGYQLLQLNDFTGQGEALVGLLDPFWSPKPGITREKIRSWNAATVILARFEKYVFTSDQILEVELELAHFGPGDLHDASAQWELKVDNLGVTASGELGPFQGKTGGLSPMGKLSIPLTGCSEAAGATLRVQVNDTANEWRFFIYPPALDIAEEDPGEIVITRRFDAKARAALQEGKCVLFLAHGLFNEYTETTGYSSVYWSAKMFNWAGNNNLGVYPCPDHPALSGFPHDGRSSWHWHELTDKATAFRFPAMPEGMRPIIQAIPDFHHAKPLLHLFEVKVGPGRLLVCGYDLASDLATRPVARQLRACLLRYMKSAAFLPGCELSPEEAHRIFAGWEKHPRQDEWRISSCDSEEVSSQDNRARNVLDGDPRTLWHTEWANQAPPHPHQITLDLSRIEKVLGLRYLPRQDGSNGRVKQYQVMVSGDEKNWKMAAEGSFDPDGKPKIIVFGADHRVRYIRLVALSETNGNPWTSAAELSPVLKDF